MRTLLVIAALLSLSAFAESLTIANGNFEAGGDGRASNWSFWSRTKDGSAQWLATEKHGGEHSVCIQYGGARDWAFSNDTRIAVKPGQSLLLTAWVRQKTGTIGVYAVALGKGKTLTWDTGSARSAQVDVWVKLEARVEIEAPCDQIYVRFTGDGETLGWVDDVSLSPAPPPVAKIPKPKVEGYATERVREKLDRGLTALNIGAGKVHVGWRLLDSDPADVAFNLYRVSNGTTTKLNAQSLVQTTDFMDTTAPAGARVEYFVRPVAAGNEGEASAAINATVSDKAEPFIRIPFQGKYKAQKVGIGDLDGDGKFDYVIKQPSENIDPYEKYWTKSPDTYKLEAYRNDGKFLWRHDLGWAIERGIWYSPYLVFDLDGDGKAEVICKEGEGDPRDADGRVQSGPEYLTILNGETGAVRARVPWIPREPFMKFGYNYASRNQLGIAYLDGKTPCLIVERGTYNLIVVVAYEFHNNTLRELWRWSNENEPKRYWGQGAHWMHGVDVDGDGRDEVVIGSACIDDNGDSLWSTGLGHPDHVYVGDLDPARPGLEIYYGMETHQPKNGMCMVDAKTGAILWGYDKPTVHIHSSGLVSDLDPAHPGAECYSGERDEKDKRWLRTATGEVIDDPNIGKTMNGLAPRAVYWDADPQRELLVSGRVFKYKGAELARVEGEVIGFADILGDWREEVITSVPGEMRIYVSPIPATDRHVCLMRDPIYRIDVAHAAMGYLQVPTLSYDLSKK